VKCANAWWLLCFAASAVAQVNLPPPPPPLQLSAAESAVLVPLVNAWKAENAVVATEGLPYMRAIEPSLRLELLRHGAGDERTEELLRALARRNAARVSIESPAFGGVKRASLTDLFRRSVAGDRALAKLGPVVMIAVPAVADDAAIVLSSRSMQLDDFALTSLAKDPNGWRVAWEKHLTKRDFSFVRDPDAVPHRAVLTADDVGVIDALVDAMHPQALLDQTTVSFAPAPHDAFDAMRAANRQRSPVSLFLGKLRLSHPVPIVDSFGPRVGALIVSLPGYSADRTHALMEYMTSVNVAMDGEALF